jgi:hypothetical protein
MPKLMPAKEPDLSARPGPVYGESMVRGTEQAATSDSAHRIIRGAKIG